MINFILIPLFLFNMFNTTISCKPILNNIEVNINPIQEELNYKDTILKHIPLHEGTRYNPYSCSAGHKTIGCGHVITHKDNFIYPLSQSQVDSLLLADVNKAEMYYNMNMPDSIRLKPNQKWAIVHFIFCKGIGNFNKSRLKQLIIKNEPIQEEILKWSYYHTPSGKLVKSDWCYNIRLFELQLYLIN
jgi:GH24 family phage-related lysozyme (muramidase)